MMFDDLVKTNNIDISAEDAKFVKALIAGDASRCAEYVRGPCRLTRD
jgi:hypothetical protein